MDSDSPMLYSSLARVVLLPLQPLFTHLALGPSPLLALKRIFTSSKSTEHHSLIRAPQSLDYISAPSLIFKHRALYFSSRLLIPSAMILLLRITLSYSTILILRRLGVNMYAPWFRVLQCVGLVGEVLIMAPLDLIRRNMEMYLQKLVYLI
jgi:hypothetical protein